MERQSEQPLLEIVVLDEFGQVEKRLGQQVAVLVDDADASHPLDNEEPATAIIWRGNVHRVGQTSSHFDELDLWIPWQRAARLSRRRHGEFDDGGGFLRLNAKRCTRKRSCQRQRQEHGEKHPSAGHPTSPFLELSA